jgi:hypothetical protein
MKGSTEYAPGSAFEGKWKLKNRIKYLYQEVKNLNLFISKICRRYNDVL